MKATTAELAKKSKPEKLQTSPLFERGNQRNPMGFRKKNLSPLKFFTIHNLGSRYPIG